MTSVRILWYSWKCWHHPQAGGAEVLTHEVSKRLVTMGYEVTLFCSEFDGSSKNEYSDGVRIIRDGGKYCVYSRARSFYDHHNNEYDIVIDEINTRPFMTPKFVEREKIIAIIFQLAREYWFYETKFPVNYLGYYFLEKRWLSRYVDLPVLTISESTKNDLLSWGFRNLDIFPVGSSVNVLESPHHKNENATLIFIGRLTKAKRPGLAILAFKTIRSKIPNAELWMVGDGYLRKTLEKDAPPGVSFFGRVSESEKYELLRKAHFLIVPGIREGWGLNVIEANAMGTPAIAYDVPGLRDAITDGYNGVLVRSGNLAEAILKALSRPMEVMSENSLSEARKYSWERTAQIFVDKMTILRGSRKPS